MDVSELDYQLPPHLIARYPAPRRDESRLLVLRRDSGAMEHRVFKDIVGYIGKGDVVVLNDTKVLPARLDCRKETGGKVELLLVEPVGRSVWKCMVKGRRVSEGRRIVLPGGEMAVVRRGKDGYEVEFPAGLDVPAFLERHGRVPLPPYIGRRDEAVDRERYQTVYASHPGSVAAPTAGLHFTPELLEKLRGNGVDVVRATLHVGPGTFLPVRTPVVEAHRIHREWFKIPESTAEAVARARERRSRVFAVGTTVCRMLESAAPTILEGKGKEGWTDLFIKPPYEFKVVDALVTNFHLPRSTLLALVFAFAGRDNVMRAYEAAIERGYRFYSYGDAMLIV